MKLTRTRFAAFAMVLLLVSSAGIAAAATLGANPEADQYPETKIVEDELTVESHDRTEMGWLEYENDNGEVTDLNATVNGTEGDINVAYRADLIDADALGRYPRVDGEENNSVTWLDTTNWTESGATVSDTDGATGSGVDSIEVTADVTDGSSSHAAYAEGSLTDDVEKRYLQFVVNVDELTAGSEVAIQVRDDDGDYVEAVANSSRDGTADDVFANSTASGVIYQEQLGQLPVEGSGDGSLDAVEEVRVVVRDGDATVTMTGLNVEKKSQWDFGDERVLDTSTDEDDDYTDVKVTERPEGGVIEASSLQGMGDTFTDATIHKLVYYNVEYRMQDSPGTTSILFPEADAYPNFPYLWDSSTRLSVPTAYDLTHGNLELTTEQTFLGERYVQLRYAEGVGDTDAENVSDDEWIDLSDSLGEKNTTIAVDDTVQPDSTYVVETEVKLVESQYNALQPVAGGTGGFWGDSAGRSPFHSLYNWLAGGVVGLMTMLGLGRFVGK
ncbi:hypothetical protein [Halorarum salinum]|uniref:Uncharacterized protein n=1 Tax=Halorarum salinum TaxID=2743089 RepID=A0A7D5QGN8_9EURY|nr:hypothetical protein [Halobaculum salinum]QLG62202.1 hypothetical protein HUG12_10855 [Halobaculum salinum]